MLNRYKLLGQIMLLICTFVLSGCENYAERTHQSWVAPPEGMVFDDSTIYARIIYAVQSDADLQGTDIDIKVNDGDVLLSGTVNNRNQFTRINMHTWTVDGVKNVDNQVNIR